MDFFYNQNFKFLNLMFSLQYIKKLLHFSVEMPTRLLLHNAKSNTI